ncbi:MAG TPA: SemiSWEET transporter [Balneolaceae bacterium]|nr:SemiSWEET transporter [Balneolaceae bacterium]
MSLVTLLGLTAGALTTIAFVPQVIKTWKTKSADDLSLGMYSIFCSGVALWLIYGLIRKDIPIIVSNIVTFTLAMTILYFKFAYHD